MKKIRDKPKQKKDPESGSDTKLIIVLVAALLLAIVIIAAIMLTSAQLHTG